MPIFHDSWDTDTREQEKRRKSMEERIRRKKSEEESLRLAKDGTEKSPPRNRDSTLTTNDGRPLSREELIERIKRGESPTWTIRHGYGTTPEKTSPKQSPCHSPTPSLLPSVELKETTPAEAQEPMRDNYAAGLEIERPGSALHSGDFRSEKDRQPSTERISPPPLSTSPPAPWLFTGSRSFDSRSPSRSRASTLVRLPPTSPLVQALSNTDLEYPQQQPIPQRRRSRSPERDSRRHTFSPQSFQAFQAQCFGQSPGSMRPMGSLRRGGTFPYQAHQPRRSISSIGQLQANSTPQTPLVRSRAPSQSSEISPLHHAPMVGSYEESILRGRMSTIPSRPLNFIAQIGVLGKGKCKPSLRCPPHAVVPFPAVFYSYNAGNGRISDNQPSPYVGLVDLENSLPPPEENDEGRRRRRYTPSPGSDGEDVNNPNNSGSDKHAKAMKKKRERLKRRSQSPKAPPGGSYRIPQQGQLQIIIKNPNKTAVKLFLIPYDLSDMEPGQKTFIRQRSYSAGPIIDMPLSMRKNLGTNRPEAALSTSDEPNDRPTLRYLIHLHICCTGKGRYYLYKSIRVVFANRVPDGKEKLRNEVQLPDPKYSAYKPIRDSQANASGGRTQTSALGAALAAEKAARRRSIPFNFAQQLHAQRPPSSSMDEIYGIPALRGQRPLPQEQFTRPLPPPARSPLQLPCRVSGPIRPIPFTLAGIAAPPALTSLEDMRAQQMELDSPILTTTNSTRGVERAKEPSSPMVGVERTKSDATPTFSQGRQSPSMGFNRYRIEGLLTRRLKEMNNSEPEDSGQDGGAA